MGADVAAEREERVEVYLDDLFSISCGFLPWEQKTHVIPIIDRELRAGMPSLYPGAIDQNVDFVPILQDRGREGYDFLLR